MKIHVPRSSNSKFVILAKSFGTGSLLWGYTHPGLWKKIVVGENKRNEQMNQYPG